MHRTTLCHVIIDEKWMIWYDKKHKLCLVEKRHRFWSNWEKIEKKGSMNTMITIEPPWQFFMIGWSCNRLETLHVNLASYNLRDELCYGWCP
jgi:hypothetical protein